MRIGLFFLLILMLPGLSFSSSSGSENKADYCYKPNKPLWFSTHKYKQRYQEDMEEYQRCVQQFHEVHDNIAKMKAESDKNAQKIMADFVNKQP